MLKKMCFVVILLLSCFAFTSNVLAYDIENESIHYSLADSKESCPIFGDPNDKDSTAAFLQDIFSAFKIIAPVLCIVLIIVDLVKAVVSQDKDALTKAGKTAGLRMIYAVILFFLPDLINFLFGLLGWYGTCGIR